MKNVFRIILVALLAGVATQVDAQTASQKIGYTNVDYILSQMPETKVIETEIKTKEAQYQTLIGQKQKDLQDKYANYQKNSATMSEVIRADMEKQMQGLQTNLQEFQQNAVQELQGKQQQLLAPVLEKIDKAIKEVAKENGYTFVLSTDISRELSPVLLYTTEEYNLTDLVFKKMGVTPKPVATTPAAPANKPAASNSTTPKKN
ncbi:MAG: OmpH family outer membrane protein [Cytophagaceae bacterium]|nr:OmpH family outer membrane protein [Cytophagaceae bacterium]